MMDAHRFLYWMPIHSFVPSTAIDQKSLALSQCFKVKLTAKIDGA
jgi:hypothetical protein